MYRCPTMLSGPVAAPPPIPFRPLRRDGDMPWEEAIERHLDELARERAARSRPWTPEAIGAAVADATARLVALQAPGLDLLDEGRLHEDQPLRAAARLFRGFELEAGLAVPQQWIPEAAPPRLVAPPVLVDDRALRRRWQAAQLHTEKPVKLSLLGPRSLAGAIDDALHGTDVDAGAATLAEALNPGLRQLAEAGCPALELVEPALLGAAPAVTPRGFEAIARALHKVPRATRRWLRLVPADAREPWLGPPPPAVALANVAPILADLPIDGIVVEPARAHADAGVLERWRLAIALLVVPADAGPGFRPDEAAGPLIRAASILPPERLMAAVDGGGSAVRAPLAARLAWLDEAARAAAPRR